MKSDRHVKIIIPCTNEGEWLRVTVDSILEQTDYPSFEIVVSANGDRITDFSFLDDPPYRNVTLLRTERALGVGNARNVATAPGDAAFYVFLDAHCLVDARDWLQRAVDCLERHPEAAMIQPEVCSFVYEDDVAPGQNVEAPGLEVQQQEYSTCWAWPYNHAGVLVEMQTAKRSHELWEAMSGAGMAVFTRAGVFHRLGRFDSEVEGWFHETMDYCVRSWLSGYRMLVDPNIRIYHRAKTRREEYHRPLLHIIHGTLRTAYKYLSPRRRDLAETLFRKHGLNAEVDAAIDLVRRGKWLAERVEHLKNRMHDDDWLFSKFDVYEERFCGQRIGGPCTSSSSGESR